jgi:hypothetical protein
MTLFFTGISFIIAAAIISPLVQDFLYKYLHINYLISVKFIIVLIAILVAIYSLKYTSDEDLLNAKFLIYKLYIGENVEKLTNFLDQEIENQKKQQYLAVRDDIRAELQYLYDDGQYQEIITQGISYISFDAYIRRLYENSKEELKQQQRTKVLNIVHQLIKEGKYKEAYYLAEPFKIPELQKLVIATKKQIDKNFKRLRTWYEIGRYKKVIKIGSKQIDSDCRIKTLIARAKIAQTNKERLRKIKKTIKKISRLIDRRKYTKAMRLVAESEFSNNSKLQVLVKRAKSKLNKAKEKKILKKLRNIPSSQIEANLREYANLLELFPDNKRYQQKLFYYNQKAIKLGKNPPLRINKKDYTNWPFIVSQGELECIPPGIVTFKNTNKTYAISELAIATGDYLKIDIILLEKTDIKTFVKKGLDLCS